MRFSIVTVTFNAQLALPATLDSLAAQRWRDLEWLVQDGASSDGTLAQLRAHPAAAMGLQLVSERDGGIYDGMNRAIARARGDWLFFLNAGDALADPGVLADVAAAADADGGADLIVGEVLMQGSGAASKRRSYAHLGPTRLLFDSLCHQAVFARRSLFERFGTFDTRYRYSADYDWLLRTMRGGARVTHLPRLVAHFDAGGAHVQAAAKTAAENEAVRRAHASALTLALGRAWFHNTYRLRRVLGLEATGHHTLPLGQG
jgi:glycosyltransferase involved in cell wall biosynthesis